MLKVKSWLSCCWKQIKKLPEWSLFCFLILGSVIFSLLKRSSNQKKIIKIQKEISDIEKDRNDNVRNIIEESEIQEELLKKEFQEKIDSLKQEEEELRISANKGPAAIAAEWNKFLLKKNDT